MTIVDEIENNNWILAMMIILSTVGYKYIGDDLQEKRYDYLKKCKITRKLIIFSLIFITTKNIKISLISTLLYTFIIHYLL